jgi:arsenite-transporting ATPase
VRYLLPRLRDPEFASIVLVTLPEATPVHEAAQLQDDLRRAAIEPFAWIVNQSFAGVETTDPVLRARGRREAPYLDEVRLGLASRMARIPWRPEPPVGWAQLEALALGLPAAAPART